MLLSLTLFTWLWLLPLALFLSLFILFVALPIKRMSFYRGKHTVFYYFPIIGPFKLMQKELIKNFDSTGSNKRFTRDHPDKKLFVSNMNTRAFVLLRDTEYIKKFLQNQSYYEKAIFARVLSPLLGTGLVLAEGETWKRHRKIVSGSFHYEFLKSNIESIQKTARDLLNAIPSECYENYPVITKIQEITGAVVGQTFFGELFRTYTYEGKTITLALANLILDLALTGRNPLVMVFGINIVYSPAIPKFVRLMKRVRGFRSIISKIIEDRRNGKVKSNDMLQSLLETQESKNAEERFSDENIIDEFITFFLAGMDTVGHLIGMSIYNLTQYPEYLKGLEEERKKTYDVESVVSGDTLQKMDVLHGFLKETLRFYTPAPWPFARTALKDHRLGDLHVKKGDIIRPDFFPVFFDEKYFEDPQKFKPERWNILEQKVDPYSFIPFSAGTRNCIGQHLAIIEAKIVISEFVKKFKFEVHKNYKLKMVFNFLYEPVEDVRLKLTPIK